jgi:uncharacterized membrane protein YfcA
MPELPFSWSVYAIAAAVTVFAYFIFGITAFGASLFTAPVLAFFLPLQFVLPVTTLLDVAASLALGVRFGKATDRSELAWMLPFMIAGAITGALLLIRLPRDAALASFGVFLLLYGAYTLWQPPATRPVSRKWAPVAGYTGGTMGTLFGVGGAPYAIYLSRRITDKVALRTTLSSLVLLSVTVRLIVFGAQGLATADRWIAAAMLAPCMGLGLWLGNKVYGRITREQLVRLITVLLAIMGVMLLVRAAAL